MNTPTRYHIVFTESTSDPAAQTAWHQGIRETFPTDPPPQFRIEANMTAAEFRLMTGEPDPTPHLGYVIEHYDGPGVFSVDMAKHETDSLYQAINEADEERWLPIDTDELDPEGWQCLLDVMKATLSLDWEVQSDIVDANFVNSNRDKISRFMQPVPQTP